MIDWMTLRLPGNTLGPEKLAQIARRFSVVQCTDPDGVLLWRKPSRESIRSDSHQLTVECHTHLVLHGSPARLQAENNVFGSGDPRECARMMIEFAEKAFGIELPKLLSLWHCTRIDITHNYALPGPREVLQALSILRQSEGGRFQVKTAAETVYWGQGSALRTLKAYAKGPHLLYQFKKNQANATLEELELAGRLLRLELSLKGQYWREKATKSWHQYTETELDQIHESYFSKVMPSLELTEMDNIQLKLEEASQRLAVGYSGKRCPFTPGLAMSAYRTWALIQAVGLRNAQESMPRQTWMRHKQLMLEAGLSRADLHAGNVVPFRRRTIELGAPVRSWAELRAAA